MGGAQRGSTLIEALVALAVFSISFAAIAHLQLELLRRGWELRARAAALHLAGDKLAELRTQSEPAQYGALATSDAPESVTVGSTTFERTWTVTPRADPPRKEIAVAVTWGSAGRPTHRMALSSTLAWQDPVLAAAATEPPAGPLIPEPAGGGMQGDKTLSEGRWDAHDNGDGTWVATNPTSGEVELLDGDGRVVLKVPDGLVRLKGTITLAAGVHTRVDLTGVRPLTSATGHCVWPAEATRPPVFHCYVARQWYGNLGVVGFHSHDELCPAVRRYTAAVGTHPDLVPVEEEEGSLPVAELPHQDFVIQRGGPCE